MKKFRFRIGDLVREKRYEATEDSGYGIVTMSLKVGKMIKYRCVWCDDKEYWVKENNLYLIARGQSGHTS
jgi:hypothetical protein